MTEVEAISKQQQQQAFRRFIAGVRQLSRLKAAASAQALAEAEVQAKARAKAEEEAIELCCSGVVHIAYRGLADDRMYMSYSRKWSELRFFRANGLRVFCADCRQRVL
jgi:hypothetical protein